MTFLGHLQDGIVVLDSPPNLPNGTAVRVEIPETAVEVDLIDEDDGPTLLESLKPFIGVIKDMPPDMARNHDHYLYGTPKRP